MNSSTFLIFFIYFLNSGGAAPMTENDAMDFLEKFGYMENKAGKEAIKNFQNNFEIPQTGMLDAATITQMEQPRCGRPDGLEIESNPYVWPKNYLRYTIKNGPVSGRLSRKKVEDEMQEAFKLWGQHIPVTFEHSLERGDIEIHFVDPQNGEETDGTGKTLAYAYYPVIGDIYFDVENWGIDSKTGFNFRAVAAHEIGHSMGLEHSKNKKALMYPFYEGPAAGWTLPEVDISDIKALYNKDHVCEYGHIDGIFPQNDDEVMVVKGRHCWKFEKNKLARNYPKLCGNIWGKFPANFDAIFTNNEKQYFFSENALFSLRSGLTRKVDFNLESIKKIDTVLTVEDRLYIFEGTKYWSFVQKNTGWTRKGNSRLIEDFWKGVPSNLDAAIYDNKKYVYFFKDADVYKFNIDTKLVVKSPFLFNEIFSC